MKRKVRTAKRAILGLLTASILTMVLGLAPAAHAGGPPTSVVDSLHRVM